MKATLKNIYLNLRKYLLRALAIFISHKKFPDVGSGQDIEKVLFIRIDRIGDLVLSTPALRALKQAFPHSELVVLASPSNNPLIFNNPNVDHLVVYDRQGRLIDRIKVIQKLRESGFDLAIDPYADYELETALIAFFSGAKKRVGYASYGREVFFNINSPKIKVNQHFVDLTLGIVKSLGIKANGKKLEIFLADDEKKWAKNSLKERGVGGKPIVGIHPGGYYESQRWLPERFSELVNYLQQGRESDPIIFGGPRDKELINRICSMVNSEVLTYMTTDLRLLTALVSCCCVLVCNNSGPLHIAVALNIPTISFMGPTDKNLWMPIGDIHKVLRMDDLTCIGCNLGYCKIKTHDCMRLITPSMAIEAIEDIVKT